MGASLVKAVVSDFAGVLTESLQPTFRRFEQRTGISRDVFETAVGEVAAAYGRRGLEPLELGICSEAEWGLAVSAIVYDRTGMRLDLRDFGARWWFPGRERNDEFIAYLGQLRGAGYMIAMLTNNVREWEPLWRSMIPEADELFDVVVNSCEEGVHKPDEEIFARACDRLELAPEQCVLVDDLAANCAGARAAGWRAVQYRASFDDVRRELDELLHR